MLAGRSSRVLMAPLMLAAALTVLGPGAASAATCGTGAGQPLQPGSSDIFEGVAITSCRVWAVGDYTVAGHQRTLIERWNNTAWTRVPSPSPVSSYNILLDVAAASAGDAWAVGQSSRNPAGHVFHTLAEHWNGTAWTQAATPNPGTGDNYLASVAATSAGDAWAVGGYDTGPGTTLQALAAHWNGTAWTQVPTPNPGGGAPTYNYLNAVAATSGGDAWAVGSYSASAGGSMTLIEHWNGTAWTQVPSPSPGITNHLSGVAALSPTDAWAVGSYSAGGDDLHTLVEHWDGTAWTQVPTPSPNRVAELSGIAATGAGNVWATGYYIQNVRPFTTLTLVYHWTGTAWHRVPSPSPSSSENRIGGVAVTSAAGVWAVGFYQSDSQPQTTRTFAFHCC
jgi:hypothetical protein